MATTLPGPAYDGLPQRLRTWSISFAQTRWSTWLPLAAVVTLALVLNSWALSGIGYGNTYYAAAAKSMSESWHNFFFGAFDPGGFITVDKPPVFLWFDALSVRIFGYSSWSLLLPSAVAGAAAVGLLWLIVRRSFGVSAATIAGAVLALTPISVAVNRLNLPEPFYVLFLVGAAGCVLQSYDSRRWWAWLIGAGVLVGLAFNTKMLAAWIPGPALALAVVAGLPISARTAVPTVLKQWLPRLALFGVVSLVVSASWMVVVDSWPASDRPYIGGSTDNTVSNLVLGYNGIGRVEGENGAGGPRAGGGGGNFTPPANTQRDGGGFPDGGGAQTNRGAAPGGGGTPGGAQGAGGIIAGQPDLFRMFDAANGAQIAWFLPFALIGGFVALWRWRAQPVLRGAVLLWVGWVVLFGGVFSYTQGIYHSYYTSALAPGIAALAGVSTVGAADLIRRNRLWVLAAAAMVLVTVWVQLLITGRYEDHLNWLRPYGAAVAVLGLVVLGGSLLWPKRLPLVGGPALAVAGLLILPGVWSGYEAAHASLNTTLPQAGPREGAAGRSFGSDAFDNGTVSLARWLEANNDPDATWDLAVASAQNASSLIARFDLSVLPIGGFSGRDPTITAAEFGELVAEGKIRYVLTTSGMGGGGIIDGVQRQTGPDGGGFPGGVLPDGTNRQRTQQAPGAFGGTQQRGTQTLPGAQQGGAQAFPGMPQQGTAANAAAGASAVFSAVQSVCTPVTGSGVPTQYQGSIYDCAGMAEALPGR
jgi:4-amino-4-deoxy-L-arabinose transferase-like glycosyltransferase